MLTSVSPGQLLIKIAHDELAELMGGQQCGHQPERQPHGRPDERPAGLG